MKTLIDIDAKTEIAAVIGYPLNHSLSPAIYNLGFMEHQLNMIYLGFETTKENTVQQIERLKGLKAKGINITMPGKVEAMKCVDRLDPVAYYVQAVNMITQDDNGDWVGYNTDGEGLWLAIKHHQVNPKDKKVVIYGSGSTSTVILAQAILEGVSEVSVVARSLNRPLYIKRVIDSLHKDYPQTIIRLIDLEESESVKEVISQSDIIIQSTSLGMCETSNQSILENADWLNPSTVCVDVVYEPTVTKFMKQAQSKGCYTIGGLDMLVYQAKRNFELFAHHSLPVDKIMTLLQNRMK